MNEPTEMTLARFEAILGAYGAQASRWPAAEREAAERLLSRSPEAQAAQRRAAALDMLLDSLPAPVPSERQRAAILAGAPRERQRRRNPEPSFSWAEIAAAIFGWRPAGAMLATGLLLGVLAGGLPLGEAGDIEGEFMQMALLADSYDGYAP